MWISHRLAVTKVEGMVKVQKKERRSAHVVYIPKTRARALFVYVWLQMRAQQP